MALFRFSNMATPTDKDVTVKIMVDIHRAEGEVSIEPLPGPKKSTFVVNNGKITYLTYLRLSSRMDFLLGVFMPSLKSINVQSEMRKAGLSEDEATVGLYLFYYGVLYCQAASGKAMVPLCCVGGTCVKDWAETIKKATSMKQWLGRTHCISAAADTYLEESTNRQLSLEVGELYHAFRVIEFHRIDSNIATYIKRMGISEGMVGHELNRACNLVGAKDIFELEDKIIELL